MQILCIPDDLRAVGDWAPFVYFFWSWGFVGAKFFYGEHNFAYPKPQFSSINGPTKHLSKLSLKNEIKKTFSLSVFKLFNLMDLFGFFDLTKDTYLLDICFFCRVTCCEASFSSFCNDAFLETNLFQASTFLFLQ